MRVSISKPLQISHSSSRLWEFFTKFSPCEKFISRKKKSSISIVPKGSCGPEKFQFWSSKQTIKFLAIFWWVFSFFCPKFFWTNFLNNICGSFWPGQCQRVFLFKTHRMEVKLIFRSLLNTKIVSSFIPEAFCRDCSLRI